MTRPRRTVGAALRMASSSAIAHLDHPPARRFLPCCASPFRQTESIRPTGDAMLLEILLSLSAFVALASLWNRGRYDLSKIPSPPSLPWVGKGIEMAMAISRGEDQFAQRDLWLRQTGNPKVMRVRPASTAARLPEALAVGRSWRSARQRCTSATPNASGRSSWGRRIRCRGRPESPATCFR